MTEPLRQQALTVWLPLARGSAPALGRELAAREGEIAAGLGATKALHFARLALVPETPRFAPGLLLETLFDGELDVQRAELSRVFAPHARLWADAADGPLAFTDVLTRYALRAAAFYFAPRGQSLAAIREGSAAEQRAQTWLADFSATRSASAREIAEQLRRELAPLASRDAAAGRELPADSVRLALSRARERWLDVARAPFLALALELRDAFRRDPVEEPCEPLASSSGEQSAFAHVVPLRPGRRRAELVELFTWILDGACAGGGAFRRSEPFGVHSARWLFLPDGRLAFLAWHDGSSAAWLDRCLESASSWVSLLWSHTEGFPRTRGLAFGGARRQGAAKRWLGAHQVRAQIWYSAYPGLSVQEIEQNRRLGELLAGPLDETRARELCALL